MYVIWTGAGAAFGGVTARAAAESSGVNRNMAILFCHKLREVIFAAPDADTPELLAGEIKVDESYFGGRRKGRRGRGAAGKIPVSGLLKRSGKVQVVIVPNAFSDTLIPIIREKSGLIASSTPMPSTTIPSGGCRKRWRGGGSSNSSNPVYVSPFS